jgi:hypothetical protein
MESECNPMVVEGSLRNGVVVPDSPLNVPEGTRVRIEVADEVVSTAGGPRRGGFWRGQVHIAPDFDELPEDIARAFGAYDA